MTSRLATRCDSADLADRLNKTAGDFLKIDVQVGLTFSGIALQTEDPQKRARTQRAARKAYDTVRNLIDTVTLGNNDAQSLARNLLRLKCDLLKLGEIL